MAKSLDNIIKPIVLLATLSGCVSKPVVDNQTTLTPLATQTPVIFTPENLSKVSANRQSDLRPNIIVIMTDDQPYLTVNDMPIVRNTLIPNGVSFPNAVATTPLCCPSRTSILTGEYAHNTQVYTNKAPNGGATIFDDTDTIGVWMKNAGYSTAYLGKYLNDYEQLKPYGVVPPGWDEWDVFVKKASEYLYYFNFSLSEDGKIVDYPKKKFNYSTDVITQKAVDYINDQKENPFFLVVGYYNPHSPYITAPRHKDLFKANSGWSFTQYRPPNVNESDISDKPKYIKKLKPYSLDELDITHRQILRSLQSVDEGIGSIIETIEKIGLTDNTVIFYLSDNGLTMGEHRFGFDKNCPYEECLKIPLIVYAPSRYEPRSDSSIIANIDLVPTIVELAGLPIPNSINGNSFFQLLNDPATDWRDEILIEHWPTSEDEDDSLGALIPEYFGIRSAEWKYIEYSTGERELYNLIQDPYELQNVANNPDNQSIMDTFSQRIIELKAE